MLTNGLTAKLTLLGSVVLVALLLLLGNEATTSAAAIRTATGQEQSVNSAQLEVRKLEVGRAVERELMGGESHTYEIAIQPGQYFSAVVEQRGIDVVVQVIAPNGKQVMEVDSPNGEKGPAPVELIAEVPGNYRINVRSLEKTALVGKYERALAISEKAIGAEHPDVAASLNTLAGLYYEKSDYAKAEPL